MALKDTTWYTNFGNGSSTGYYAVPVWPGALQSVSAGTWCRQLTTPAVGSERCFVALTTGTTGAAEPVWVVTRGADTGANIDGTVTWQECTGMPGPCGDLTNANTWLQYKNTAVSLGASIYDATSGSLQICSTAGTAGNGASPSFSATAGVVTSDGATLKWTSLGPTSNYTTAFKYPHARLANAFTATWGAAGNQFAVASNHAETQSTALTLTSPGTLALPCNVYCISSSTTLASPTTATTASISTTGNSAFTITGWSYYYGVAYNCGSGANAPLFSVASAAGEVRIESGQLNLVATGAASFSFGIRQPSTTQFMYLYNTAISFGATNQVINSGANGLGFFMQGGSIAATGSVPTTLANFVSSGAVNVLMRDVDLSAITGTLFGVGDNCTGSVTLENCKLGSGVAVTSGSFTGYSCPLKVHNCDSAATNYRYYYANGGGVIKQETTIVRTGGDTDGTTPLSWNITTSANSQFTQPFVSEEIAIWNNSAGTSLTVTAFLNTATTLNNNDFWIEVEYPASSGSPLGATVNTRMAVLGTPAALTADGVSNWGASAKANSYKCSVTFTPQMKGIIKMRLYQAKPSVTVYVDPQIEGLTPIAQSFFIPGWGCNNAINTAPVVINHVVNQYLSKEGDPYA